MLAYIKDRKIFKTKHYAPAQYDMTLKSIYDEVTTVYLSGTEDDAIKGDYIYCDGYLGIVDEVEVERRLLTLTCQDIVTLFRRDLLPTTDTATSGIEAFIKRQIDANFTNVSDTVYQLPFLDVRAQTTTPASLKPDIEGGVWNIKSFIAKARRLHGVFVDFTIDGNSLVVTIQQRAAPTHNVDLSTSEFEVLEEVSNTESIGRITAYAEDTGAQSNWYLLQNGSITQSYTAANRVDGRWDTLVISEAADVAQEVRNHFAENSYSHLIEFATYREYGLYDNVVIRTRKGKVLRSYISAVRKTSDDDRTIYKTGELRIMLDEKLNLKLGK